MRHYMVDPDNEERLLKVPPHVVAAIKAEAVSECIAAVSTIQIGYGEVEQARIVMNTLRALQEKP